MIMRGLVLSRFLNVNGIPIRMLSQASAAMSKDENGSHHHDPNQKKINFGIAGAMSGALTRCLTQPLDVVKIRFQLQIEPISKKHDDSKYKGVIQALTLIGKEEGIIGLWRGHAAAQMLSISYSIVQFEVYEMLKMKIEQMHYKNPHHHLEKYSAAHFICGGLAGCMATFCSFPFDMIRTRLIAQGANKQYTGIINGLTSMYQKEGAFGYWKGLSPALIVAGPFIGFQFTFYELCKDAILYFDSFGVNRTQKETNALGNFVAGCVAGVCAKVITYPFDLARKRMQMQNFQYARIGFGQNFWCTGLITCFISTVSQEGILGVYKGLMPSMVKAALTTALHFMFYAESLKLVNKYS